MQCLIMSSKGLVVLSGAADGGKAVLELSGIRMAERIVAMDG